MMNWAKPDAIRVQYAKPGMVLHYLYQEVVDTLRVGSGADITITEAGSLKTIAKKILESPFKSTQAVAVDDWSMRIGDLVADPGQYLVDYSGAGLTDY